MTALVVASRVGVVSEHEEVYVACLPDGPILNLAGTAALVWRAALAGPAETIVDRVASASGAAADDIAADVTAFVASLVAQGLLAQADGGGY